jgi:hypothetical protein
MIAVCTFATDDFRGSAEVLRHTALDAGGADAAFVYTEADIAAFFAEHPGLLPGSRGHGWWAWKPWCILETLRRVGPGDVVVYVDAGATVERPLAGWAGAAEHVLLFRLGGHVLDDRTNATWTKPELFAAMGRDSDEVRGAVQVNAGVQVYRNTPEAVAFAREYLAWCVRRHVVDDSTAFAGTFRDHRHDQSVLSVLAVGHPAVGIARDPTQYGLGEPPGPVAVPDGALLDHHRRRLRPARVAVVTATAGGPHLAACAASVQAQDLPNVEHHVVIDGPEHEAAARAQLAPFANRKPLRVTVLPYNVGAGGWCGHRVYGAWPWLVDADYVAFLDDDNTFDPGHLSGLLRAAVDAAGAAEDGVAWAHSLRRIVDGEGRDVCVDACESLGGIAPTVCGPGDRLVDTSCYLLDRELALAASPAWNARFRDPARPNPDRALARALLDVPHGVVRRHSVAYRAGSTADSVSPEFFLRGNAARALDFSRPDLYVFHFSPRATTDALAAVRDLAAGTAGRSRALDEWQMTLLRGLAGRWNLLDGYACSGFVPGQAEPAPGGHLPRGAAVLVTLCQPEQAPWGLLAQRADCWRIVYTLESPNVRHAGQWDPTLLARHFDCILTYARFLLEHPATAAKALWCPHNAHHLDLGSPGAGGDPRDARPADPLDLAQLRRNRGPGTGSCVMVLENRALAGEYTIPGTGGPGAELTLEALDPLRELLVRDLDDVTVYGLGWDAAAAANPGLKLGHALHRSRDPRHAVDIAQDHDFVVIAENCDVEWYASEKLYDALMAGAVPLYYGNVPPQLGVPEGPEEGVYLDLKRFLAGTPRAGWSRALRDFLRGLSPDDVREWKARVEAMRADVLSKVGTGAFAAAVEAALARRGRA